MAHGWDSYFHPPLSPDPGTVRRKSESEGGLSQHRENFSGHQDYASPETSHEAHATTSNFNTNSYLNPSVGNSSSDCLYQRYYTETPWQADGEQMGKDYLPQCANNDISDFAAEGLSTSGSFPSTFATDLQGIKQDCGIVATAFLEDYSDVSSCSDADVSETRPSCKFMANTSVQKHKTDVTTKHSLPEWLFGQSRNVMFQTENLCSNMSQTNINLPTSSNVKTRENIVKDKMKSPEKLKSSAGHDQSSATSNVVLTIISETVENRNNSDGCEYQKQKKDMEIALTTEKHSNLTVSGYKNLSDGIEEYQSGIQEEQITEITSSILTEFHKEQDPTDEKASKNESEESFNHKNEGLGNVNSADGQERNTTEDERTNTKMFQRSELEPGLLENKPFDSQKCLNPYIMDDQDKNIEIKCKERELKTYQSTCSPGTQVSGYKESSHKPKQQFYKHVAGHLSDYSDSNEQSVSSHANSRLHSISFNRGVNPCLGEDWTTTGEKTDVTFTSLDCNDLTRDSLFTDTSDVKGQSVVDLPEFVLQADSSSTEIKHDIEKELTDPSRRTSATSTTDQECIGPAVTSDKNDQNIFSHAKSHLQPKSLSTDINPCLEKEMTNLLEDKTKTSFTGPDCSGSGVINDRLSIDTSNKNEKSVADLEFGLQTDGTITNENPCLEKDCTSEEQKKPTTSPEPHCSGSDFACESLSTNNGYKNMASVADHLELGFQTDCLSKGINACLEKDSTGTKKKTTTLFLGQKCNGPSITSDKNDFVVQTGSLGINPALKEELTSLADRKNAPSSNILECSSSALTGDINKCSVSSYAESCLRPSNSNGNLNPCVEKDTSSRETTFSTENTKHLLHESLVDLDPQMPGLDVSENARESFEFMETSLEEQSALGMLYGEPLSREESSCDTNESKLDTSQYKETPEAEPYGSSMENSKWQALQLNPSGEMRRHFHPIVILKTLESGEGMNNSYRCAICKHTTYSVNDIIEHHHCCHSVLSFQFCKTCDLYLIRNEEAEKHLCSVTKDSPKFSSDCSPQKKTCRGKHKCNRCGLIFSKIVQYIRHMRIHTGKTPFKCNKCGLYFAQAGTLQRHQRILGRCKQGHQVMSSTVSSKAKTTQPNEDLVKNRTSLPECNVKLVDISKTNLCSLCGKCFLTAEATEMHVYNIHKRKSSAVSTNQFSTKVNSEKTEEEEKEKRAKYKCPLCPRLFKYSYNRARHLRDCVRDSVYGGKEKVGGKYRCPLCHTTFTLSSNRYRHIKAFCLRQCLSRLAKEKAKSSRKVEQKIQPKENEDRKIPKANEQKKQAPINMPDPGTLPRYKCSLCPAAFRHASGKYKHMKKHELFKLTGKMFRYRIPVFSTISKPTILKRTNNEKIKDNLNSTETNRLTLSCHFCGKCFSTSQSLKKHEHNHRGERPYRCLECGKGFKKRAHLFGHRIVHQRRIQCTVCRKILPTIGELIQHRNSHLKRGMLQCPDCYLQFQYPAHLLRHLDAHRNRGNKAPQLEERTQLKPMEPGNSVKEEAGPKQVQCSLCKEMFNDAQVLRKHCLTHISGSSSNQCPFCKHNFNNRRYLLRHMIKHTGDKPYSCENCGKQFYRHLYLKLHNESCFPAQVRHPVTIESHTKTKRPYQCSYCPRSFCKKMRLKNHQHGHKANTLLLCSRCGQYFGFRKLNQHQKNCGEAGDPIADCPNIKSSSQTNQNVHKISLQPNSSKVLQLKCPHCVQRFRYRSLLLRHLVSHTGLQPYACMHCGHRYGSRTMCLQHEAFCDGVYKEGLSKVKSNAATKRSSMPTLGEATLKPQTEDETEYKCKFCTKTFIKSRNLRHHILTHNEVKPYRCKACDSCFSRYDHLKVHQARCKGKKQRLEVCIPKISLDDVGKGWQLRFGIEPTKKQESFECKDCRRSFTTQSKLSRHITMFHVTKLFKCTRCGSSFAHEKSLKKHRKMKRCNRVSNDCPLPPGPDPPTEKLTNPLQGVKSRILQRIKPCFNKKYKYVCSYCPRAFGNSWQLGVHTRLHTGEKPFSCDYCGESFIRKDYLQRHFAKCTKKQLNQVLCDRCGGFFSQVKLEDHKKNCTAVPSSQKETKSGKVQQSVSQSPPKGFSCAYCNSRFLLFSQLQEHFLNEHKLETMIPPVSTAPLQHHLSNIPNIKEEPLDESYDKHLSEDTNLTCKLETDVNTEVTKQFFCPECCISFASKSGLSAHLRGHARRYPFKCKTCKKGFWNKSLLRNHYRKCRFSPTSERDSTQHLKAEIDFALNESVLVFKEGSKTTGTVVLQTNFSCKDESTDKFSQNSEEALVQSSSSKEKKAVQYQCSECDKSFTDGLLLISHLEDHGREEQEKKRNTCSKCGRVCNNQSSLDKHMKMHGIDKKYPCPDCSKMAYTLSDLEIHRTCHDPNRPFACKLCNQRFWTRPSLCNHYGEDHRDDAFFCRFCNKAYSVKKSLARHYKKWHQKEQKDLGAIVQGRGNMEEQSTSQVSTTGESDEDENNGSWDSDSDSAPYFPCHVCGKTFPTSESLEDHQRCHLGEKPHECEECGKCFFQASQLQQHQRMHKSEFQCQACGRGFVSLFALRKHKHTHGKSRPYRCSRCHLSFTGPSQLAEHMPTHREENFPCDICNRMFQSKSSRAEHRKSHSKSGDQHQPSVLKEEHEKPSTPSENVSLFTKELKYRCGVCSERFKDPEELSEHGCMATKERPFSCSDCSKHFLHASHLKKHKATHETSRSSSGYPCNKCNKSFSSSEHFLSHLKTHDDTAASIKLNLEERDEGPSHDFICPVCHQGFASAAELSCHFSSHSDGTFECKISKMQQQPISANEFECKVCGQSFLGSDAFHQHDCSHQQHTIMEDKYTTPSAKVSPSSCPQVGEDEEVDVTGEDLYNCPHCSRQFSSKSSLLEHQNKHHSNEKPFSCELCGKSFALRRYLKEHERRHRIKLNSQSPGPEKKFRCIQCHTKFSTTKDLSVHLRLHAENEVGEFRCDMCYKSFSHWHLLKLHQESHVGEVVYECTECDKAFAFPHLLEEHQQTHAGSSH